MLDRSRSAVHLSIGLLKGGNQRRSALLRLRRPANLFQPHNDTVSDRYPEVFRFLADDLRKVPFPRILSFGCSIGDEVVSLRRYIPGAQLVGMDINGANIADCQKRDDLDRRMSFERGGRTDHLPSSHFDAVLAMAVFRHGDLGAQDAMTCGHRIHFSDFDRTVSDLVRTLRPNGLLAIEHSNFRFRDTSVSSSTVCVLAEVRQPDPRTPLFDVNDHRLPPESTAEIVFRKLGP